MTEGGLTLGLLAESALRSLLLGACVLALLKLARLRDLRTETMIWTVVLFVAMAMPLLSILSPAGFAIPLPHLAAPSSLASTPAGSVPASPSLVARVLAPIDAHPSQWLWGLYALVAVASLARLAAGLGLTVRLYRTAEPIGEDWARGRSIRASTAIAGPLSFADCILLPADYRGWSNAKLLAVLAHEEAHIQRGDFFVQLLASIHRALFWFSPFAWWLQSKLRELAETASDEAAIQRINDPAAYAEILVEVSRKAHRAPVAMAMARGPGVARRIDHILSGLPERALGAPARIAAMAAVLAASLGLAQVHAAIPAASAPLQRLAFDRSDPAQTPVAAPVSLNTAPPAHAPPSRTRVRPAAKVAAASPVPVSPPAEPPADFTYNPRALLDEPDAAVVAALIPLGGGDRKSDRAVLNLDTVVGSGD